MRDLGGMVSGYRDYYPLDFVDRPMAAARPSAEIVEGLRRAAARLRAAAPATPTATPATCCSASIAEMAGGEPFAAALQRRLFTPLGLTHTRYEPARGGAGPGRGLHAARPRRRPSRRFPEGEGWIGAAGGIWSTPSDLLTLGPGADGRQGAVAASRARR